MSNVNKSPIDDLDKQANEIVKLRNRSLLVLYYPDGDGTIKEEDIEDIYGEFRRRGWVRNSDPCSLDVLFHTFGGDPIAAYRIAQIIRDFSNNVVFLIPEHAYSAGTLTCLSGNEIRLGAYAALSPIDITMGSRPTSEGVQLLNIDYFMQFVASCRAQIEQMLKNNRIKGNTDVDCQLLVEMIKQVGALNVGRFFRERTLTGDYANRLLNDYMLSDNLNKKQLSQDIIHKLLFEMPSHSFEMDYHICKEIELPVVEMSESESDITKKFISMLEELTKMHIICKDVGNEYKLPFFRLYNKEEAIINDANPKTS